MGRRDKMNIGDRIKNLRLKKGITVNKLANLAGVSQSYLRDIELGKKQPTVEYLSYICTALDITLEAFFANEDNNLTNEIKNLNERQKNALFEMIKSFKDAK